MPAAQTTPQGYQWIRELLPDVQWDEATKSIKLPGGPSVPLSATKVVNGRAYVTPSQLASWYATYQPKISNVTPETVQSKVQTYQQALKPLHDYYKEYLDFSLNKIQQQADAQRKLAEAAYNASRNTLEKKETSSWNSIVKSALSRGLGASPLVSYEQRQVAEAYAPEYQQLESNRAAQLANIASQAALAADELALKGKEQEAQWASSLVQYALDALQEENKRQESYKENLAKYFADLASEQAKAQQEAEKLAFEKEKAYLPYQYATKNALLPYEMGMTPYQSAQIALNRERLTASTGSSGIPKTNTERKQLATATYLEAGVNRYNELKKKGYNYPLYYAVSSMLRDPNWTKNAIQAGVDVKAAVDALIKSKTKMTPTEYFSKGTGAKLKKYYDELSKKTASSGNMYEDEYGNMQSMQ